ATVYCSHLQDTDRDVWSVHQGEVPNPLATAQPVAPQYGVDNESAVRVCVQQTGHTVQQCINDILHDNGFGS
ncbi:MAG: serine/threonine protein kinase, partial [Mycobacterium sp.]|nr:serine/threonine protein kinase [Mycobacterium sp.]